MISMASRAEIHALEAENLDCFSGLKLKHVKEAVAEALSLVGRNGLFDQYTRHDVSHIDQMLAMTTWLIPDDTWELLTPTDSMLQVLAIYLHDLGMLVTDREYEHRDRSGWHEYASELFTGDRGADYKAKVEALSTEESERFLYQEYVRAHHGERVRAWISGSQSSLLGETEEAASLIADLLQPLPDLFREDLGLVCESHHRSDLANVDIYPISRPYGASEDAAANVQYAAFVLRSTDLLHITSDRTPSVLFRLIAPDDPISQEEWAKQSAVTSVRSKPATDEDGNVDNDAPRDTIEVVAQFSDEDGFFGLSAYLTYVGGQLRQTYDWSEEARRRHGSVFSFPWKYVDESQILTKGFLRDSFEFTLDTKRVLDLLTGHTLYNNTSVVVRELVQNAIDAIRVQGLDQPKLEGLVQVGWNSSERTLTIADNGTGMSQAVIERHLLRVGSSRYQDPEFQREHPNFSPISRFGIGVLSTFMVADAVSIDTVHPEDQQGRQLNLRSVHGRYLVRLFDKGDDGYKDLGTHGTRVTLRLRPSADLGDIEKVLREWILVPGCDVTLSVDGNDPVPIGFGSISEALSNRVEADGISVSAAKGEPGDNEVRIVEVHEDGLDLAYAQRWSAHFQEWSFLSTRTRDEESPEPLGTSIEGIRVEQSTPGYPDMPFFAMANATGQNAPRTDVSRSGLEQTPERLQLLTSIYGQYAKFIAREVENLADRGFSLTWSAQEASYLLSPLLTSRAEDLIRLDRAIGTIPSVVVDDGAQRRLLPPRDVASLPIFWTVESNFFRSAESLLREMPSTASVEAIIDSLGIDGLQLPDGPLVTFSSITRAPERVLTSREVSRIAIDHQQRRVDLAWENSTETPRWTPLVDARTRTHGRFAAQSLLRGRIAISTNVGHSGMVELDCAEPPTAVKAHRILFLLPDTAVANYLLKLIDRSKDAEAELGAEARLLVTAALHGVISARNPMARSDTAEYIERLSMQGLKHHAEALSIVEPDEFAGATLAAKLSMFDPWSWSRNTNNEDV
jgi:molecular chaperone HtpG